MLAWGQSQKQGNYKVVMPHKKEYYMYRGLCSSYLELGLLRLMAIICTII
jgi:hypothetical protein